MASCRIAGMQIALAAHSFDIPGRGSDITADADIVRERRFPVSFFPGKDPAAGDHFACDALESVVVPRSVDLDRKSTRLNSSHRT